MGPNREIGTITLEPLKHIETDEEFITRLDRRYQEASIELSRAKAVEIIDGDIDAYKIAFSVYTNRITIEKDVYDRLKDCGAENPDVARCARLLQRKFTYKDSEVSASASKDEGKEKNFLHLWKEACARLQFEGMQGAEALRHGLQMESNPQRRKSIYHALHEQDELLAQYVFNHIENRRKHNQASGMSYAEAKILDMDASLKPEDVRVLTEEAIHRFGSYFKTEDDAVAKRAGTNTMQPWDYPYWSHQVRLLEAELSIDWKELIIHITETLGHQDLYSQLTIRHPFKRNEIARCVMVNPPEEVIVIIHTPIEKNTEITEALHEIGHGIHLVGVRPDLLFIDRMHATPWHEAMAMIYEQMMIESLAHDGMKDERLVQSLRSKYMLRNANSLAGVLLNLYVDMELGNDQAASTEKVSERLVDLYKTINPLVVEPARYWWASNMYVVRFPFYGINYLYGFMIAAQIRSWWKRTHEEPILSKAFGDFLREKCYAPGNSVPWRQLLKEITGEDVNPRYLVDELSTALNDPMQQ